MMLPLELTLVVAATRDMGIGLRGNLPWTGLKKEMAYFARITKRLPPAASDSVLNAVIMGRKTWESIPPRFRPLKGRLNIVISRSFGAPAPLPSPPSAAASSSQEAGSTAAAAAAAGFATEPVRAGSLEQAVAFLREQSAAVGLGRVFVIGGGQVYGAALGLAETRRVLLTRVRSDFECDTAFPLALPDGDEGARAGGWERRPKRALDDWAGETVPEGVQVENETSYEFQMWERVD